MLRNLYTLKIEVHLTRSDFVDYPYETDWRAFVLPWFESLTLIRKFAISQNVAPPAAGGATLQEKTAQDTGAV